ncbi:glycosyltransferase [Virgibacillus alimentarius]|uniref:Glycosyltransferase involved in cell wall biosynthesis n=1 Tax=Virgibacillus alimentarius TaxID=698769 RepID=A0ABS4S7F9_9BACI|nr:glycosyltransferase [Virgibacillus alimentarius]MBP2257427.1 glycosyltransferase involved in cell wall biosynthesis [Virgibacillus alimentarius]
MLRFIKKTIVGSMDWFLYTFLSTKQKEVIAGMFTKKQKETLKRIIKPGKKRAQMKKVERIKFRIYELGIVQRGLAELKECCNQDEDLYLKRRAAWELALYYADQYSKDGARNCLTYIEQATKSVKDEDELRRAAVLKAESYKMLGEAEEAKRVLTHALSLKAHPDLYLAQANLATSLDERKKRINQVYEFYSTAPITIAKADGVLSAYDRIETQMDGLLYNNLDDAPKVSVIIPAYNSETSIHTAIESMLSQTWTNLEILVVDDCSTDNTKEIIKSFTQKDSRVQVLSTKQNSGAYTARNVALTQATGDFVTINDADDWSHPEKIKTQVEHLIQNPKMIGNFSNQARATEQMNFFRRGKPGIYIFPNMSSFMFRRKPVMEKLGYWDSVRFAGDSEFVKRVKLVFGEKAVANLPTAPLSFQRQSEDSLTGNAAFGFPGYFMGARKEYAEAHEHYHRTHPTNLYYEFPQEERPFPVPDPMLPQKTKKDVRRHFDVIIASEFRLLGGTNMSNIEEIKAQKKLGLKTGLVPMYRYDLNSVTEMNPNVRDFIDGDAIQTIVYGEKVSCDVLIVRHPPILEAWQKYIPDIEAKDVRVIINQPPKREYSEQGETLYHLDHCVHQLESYTGKKGTWHPIGPQIRDTLHEHHEAELASIHLADEDWVNIIDVSEWRRKRRPKHQRIHIGRHSRDQYVKWPNDPNTLKAIYPDDEKYEIHVLGGGKAPEKVLGELPANWHVKAFGEVHPKDFLADLDVFVYYTHPEWVEAFGRVIFEAMAAGVPVIIPPNYKTLFEDAAIYAKPHEVKEKIDVLMNDDNAYSEQVEKAQDYVEKHFGYLKHASRLEECSHEE